MIHRNAQSRLLFNALAVNGTFSACCGGLMLIAATPIGQSLGVDATLTIRALGLGLLLFGGYLLLIVRGGKIEPAAQAWPIIVGDLVWVLASIIMLAGFTASFSANGRWIIASVALLVLGFAGLQTLGLKRAEG